MPLYVLILVYEYVISSTEPRAQAVSTAAAVQTSEIFGVLASKYCTPLYYTTIPRSAILVNIQSVVLTANVFLFL